MPPDVDLAIVGSGFGGSILALIARRLGLRVALLERGRHPRFAIGESSSPLAGILIEQLAERYDLPRLAPLASYGAWRRSYPQVVCGLKRGFTYFKHETGRRFVAREDRSNQLLVAASPHDEVADTHWLRADVDAFLVGEAVSAGVEYLDDTQLDAVEWRAQGGARLRGHRAGRAVRVTARGLVDATGPRGFLSRALGLGERGFDGFPATQALFSHFTGVARCDSLPDYQSLGGGVGAAGAGAAAAPAPPYPVDDAAVHHVFDDGWMWVLRFGNGVTSAGVAMTDVGARRLRLADGEPAWRRLLDRYPSIAAQFASAEPVRAFSSAPRLSYRASAAAGPGWALLPSAAAFVDPMFSTGFPLTLLGVERLAWLLESGRFYGGPGRAGQAGPPPPWAPSSTEAYGRATLAEADHVARFVAGCYASFPRFDDFAAYGMFYFAAASYAEMARRVAPARAATGFLRADDPAFAAALCRCAPHAGQAGPGEGEGVAGGLAARVAAAIEAVNIAGLCDPSKRNWYGVEAVDAIDGAHKLGVSRDAVRTALSALGM